jgi:pectin methylesterase-like acyl-CoA thioesterase
MKLETIIVNQNQSIQKILEKLDPTSTTKIKIFLEKGVYFEKITVKIPHVIFEGESKEETVIVFDDANGTESPEGGKYGTFRSATFSVLEEAHGFQAKNITFKNSFDYQNSNWKENRQAVAVRCEAEDSFFENCNFIGNQDTLLCNKGKQKYKNCHIEGHIDFIFGGAEALFERCIIFSKNRENLKKENGYVCAPSTLKEKNEGFLFRFCHFQGDAPKGSVYLARPWHPGKNPGHSPMAKFINCKLGTHINKELWTSMSGFSAKNARFFIIN